MKTKFLSAGAFVILGLCAFAAFAADSEEGFVPLFDGRTLEGWVQHGSGGPFFVEDGEIVARTKDDPTGAYLCTTREYENFVFRGEYRFEAIGNSGIQFRSQIITNGSGRTSCAGYQCEMTPDGQNTTRIFDQSRTGFRFKDCRAKIWFDCNTPYARIMAARQSFFDVGSKAWQQVEIRCEGPRIRTWLNGLPVVDILDATELKGVFGLQLHPGKTGGVRWRNLRVKELPPNPAWRPFDPKNPGVHGDCAIRWKVANMSRPSATWFEKAADRADCGFDEEMLWKVPYTNGVNVCESIYLGSRAVHRVNMIEYFDVEHPAHGGAKPLRFRTWGRGTGEASDFEILEF